MNVLLRILCCITGFGLFVPVYSQSYIHEWTLHLGGEEWDNLQHLAADSSGFIYLGGQFTQSIQIGSTLLESKNERAFFLTKIDPSGNCVKSIQFSGSPYLSLDGIFTNEDNLVVVGTCRDSLSFSPLETKRLSSSGIYLAILNKDLHPENIRTLVEGDRIKINGTAWNKNGELFINGNFRKWLSVNDSTIIPPHRKNQFLLKTDVSGDIIWIRNWRIYNYNSPVFLHASSDSAVVLSGTFEKDLYIGDTILQSAGRKDMYIAKYDQKAKIIWIRSFGDIWNESSGQVVSNKGGKIHCILNFSNHFQFLDTLYISRGENDFLLTGIDSGGEVLYSEHFGGINSDEIHSLTIDPKGNIYLLGSTKGVLVIGNDTLSSTDRQKDIFLVKLCSDPAKNWVKSIKGFSEEMGKVVISTSSDHVLVGGSFNGDILMDQTDIVSVGLKDIFLTKFTDPCSLYTYDLIDSIVICPGQTDTLDAGPGFLTYQWNDGDGNSRFYEISDSSIYTIRVTDQYGCEKEDSIHVLLDTVQIDFQVVDESLPEGNNGSIITTVNGLAEQYHYLWSTGDTTSALTGISQGTYLLTISDIYGCIFHSEIAVGLDISSGIVSLSNFPNPFSESTNILYNLPEDMWIEIALFDVEGKKIITILTRNEKSGSHHFEWQRRDIPSGVYYLQIKVPEGIITKKIIITDI